VSKPEHIAMLRDGGRRRDCRKCSGTALNKSGPSGDAVIVELQDYVHGWLPALSG